MLQSSKSVQIYLTIKSNVIVNQQSKLFIQVRWKNSQVLSLVKKVNMEHVESVTAGCRCIYFSHVKCAAQCIFVRNSHLVRYAMSRAHCVDEASIKIIPKRIEGKRFRKTTCWNHHESKKENFVPVIAI